MPATARTTSVTASDGHERVAARDLHEELGALRPVLRVEQQERDAAEDGRQHERRREHGQADEVLRDPVGPRQRGEQDRPDVRDEDADDRAPPRPASRRSARRARPGGPAGPARTAGPTPSRASSSGPGRRTGRASAKSEAISAMTAVRSAASPDLRTRWPGCRGPRRLAAPVGPAGWARPLIVATRCVQQLDRLDDVLRRLAQRLAVRVARALQVLGGDVLGLAVVLVGLAAAAVHAHRGLAFAARAVVRAGGDTLGGGPTRPPRHGLAAIATSLQAPCRARDRLAAPCACAGARGPPARRVDRAGRPGRGALPAARRRRRAASQSNDSRTAGWT